jgi:hypothetical protein
MQGFNPAAGDLFPGSLAASIGGAAWAWLLAALLGATCVPLARDRGRGRILCWLVIGMAIETLAWLSLSLLGRLWPIDLIVVAGSMTVLCAAVSGRRLVAALGDREPETSSPSDGTPWLEAVSIAIVAILLALVLRLSLLPTVYYDDLVFHVAAPRQALLTGSWPEMPGIGHTFMPAAWDAAYLLPLALGGGSGPQLMNAIGVVLLAWAAVRLGRLGGGRPAAFAAAVLLVATPVVLSLGSLAGNDLFVGLALAVAAERLAATRGDRFALVGLLAGAAWAAKYTALATVAGLGLGTVVLSTGGLGRRLGRGATVGVVAVLLALPWTLRTFVLTGNPLYPAFYSLLGGRYWSARSAEIVAEEVSHGGLENRGPAAFVQALWDLLTRSADMGFPGGLNTLYLLCGLGGFVLLRRVTGGAALALAALVAYAGFCITSLNVRYALGMFAILVPFVAAIVQAALDFGARHGRSTATALGLCLALALACAGPLVDGVRRHLRYYGEQTTFFGGTPRRDVQTERIHLAALGREAATRLPRGARILLVGEARFGLLPRPTLASSAYDRPDIARFLAGATSVDEVNLRLREFTHVVVNFRELERFKREYRFDEWFGPGELELFRRWLDEGLVPVARHGTVALYELPTDPSR